MNVGVRELKQRLPTCVRRAAAGERIVVTDRGRPTAMLVPLPGGDRVELGIERGWITAPSVDDAPPEAGTHRTAHGARRMAPRSAELTIDA